MRKRPIKGSLQRSTSQTKDNESQPIPGETQQKIDSDEESDLLMLLKGMTSRTLEMDEVFNDSYRYPT